MNLVYRIILAVTLPVFIIGMIHLGLDGGQDKICQYCKGPIKEGRYIETEAGYYHPEHFLCKKCGQAINNGTYYISKNQPYCRNCFVQYLTPRCGWCRQPIEGEHLKQGNKTYHRNCYDDHIALKCAYCGEVISGEYFYDFWGNSYHPYHQGAVPQCEYCGRFISRRLTNGGQQYSDGRHICGLCYRTAVGDKYRAEWVLNEVVARLAGERIVIGKDNINLHLVDKNVLNSITGDPSGHHTGFTRYEGKGQLGGPIDRKFDIYILEGLPEIVFMAVAAHELMHVWQYTFAPLDSDPAFYEGNCNYASYLLLRRTQNGQAEYIIGNMAQSDDPIYGEGYRRVKDFARSVGNRDWLEYSKNNKSLPKGH